MSETTPGRRVRLIQCLDQWTKLAPGDMGTVVLTDDMGTVHVRWDSGARLGLLLEAGDRWEVIE